LTLAKKAEMRFLVIFAVFCASGLASPPVVEPPPEVQFEAAVRNADSVTIERARTPNVKAPEERFVATITGAERVDAVARLFRFTGEYAIAYREERGGEELYRIMNCLCFGDYSFSFSKDGREVVSITIHHWTHARSKAVEKGIDVKITKDSAEALRSFLEKSNASPIQKKG